MSMSFIWQGRQDLNLRHLVLETSALPTELLPFASNSITYLSRILKPLTTQI